MTIPIKELNNRSITYPRGHILGGSSSVSESFFESNNNLERKSQRFIRPDYMIYNQGSSEDWDRYASISEDQGWSWDAVQQYFHKACHLICIALQGLTVAGTERKVDTTCR